MRGKPFEKGDKRCGRPAGVKNRATVEIRELARAMVENPEYVASLNQRLKDGKAPHMEPVLFAYAYGKPTEKIEHSGSIGAQLGGLVVKVVDSRDASGDD